MLGCGGFGIVVTMDTALTILRNLTAFKASHYLEFPNKSGGIKLISPAQAPAQAPAQDAIAAFHTEILKSLLRRQANNLVVKLIINNFYSFMEEYGSLCTAQTHGFCTFMPIKHSTEESVDHYNFISFELPMGQDMGPRPMGPRLIFESDKGKIVVKRNVHRIDCIIQNKLDPVDWRSNMQNYIQWLILKNPAETNTVSNWNAYCSECIIEPLLQSLGAMHTAGYGHLDIKLDNVMFMQAEGKDYNKLVIIDYGMMVGLSSGDFLGGTPSSFSPIIFYSLIDNDYIGSSYKPFTLHDAFKIFSWVDFLDLRPNTKRSNGSNTGLRQTVNEFKDFLRSKCMRDKVFMHCDRMGVAMVLSALTAPVLPLFPLIKPSTEHETGQDHTVIMKQYTGIRNPGAAAQVMLSMNLELLSRRAPSVRSTPELVMAAIDAYANEALISTLSCPYYKKPSITTDAIKKKGVHARASR